MTLDRRAVVPARAGRTMAHIALDGRLWARARERAAGMPVYGYSHREEMANLVGTLGEACFERWLDVHDCDWEFLDDTRFDYRVGRRARTVDVKTKDRTVAPRAYYEVSVPDYNSDHQVPDWYVFVSLRRGRGSPDSFTDAYLVGCMPVRAYKEVARYRAEGDVDPDNGTRFWTACWNLPMSELNDLAVGLADWQGPDA